MTLSTGFRAATRAGRVFARAGACALLLAVPACRIPCLQPAEPGPGLPATFPGGGNGAAGLDQTAPLGAVVGGGAAATASPPTTQSTDSSAQIGVAEFYNDPTLTALVAQAAAGNRDLKILEQEVAAANFEVQARRGAYLPFFTAGAGGGFDRSSRYTRNGAADDQLTFPSGRIPNTMGASRVGLDFTWQLDIWRKFRNARDAAAQRYLAAVEKRNEFVTRLVADVADNYYRLMALDKRMENLDRTITLQQQSLEAAVNKKDFARGTELPVQRFRAEVQKNRSEKLIVSQEIVEAENRINFLVNRFPEPVPRASAGFYDLAPPLLSVGLPGQLLLNRPDIRRAERELAAAGLEVQVARAEFFPSLTLSGGIGYEAFNPRYLFSPDTLAANAAGNLVAPLVNKSAIRAAYGTANARQLQSLYDYQRVVLDAFTEVVNRVSMAENYRRSVELKKEQLKALETSVEVATQLYVNARVEYIEVLFAQRDLLEARTALIEAKRQQLSAVVNAYQALGGGVAPPPLPPR